MAQSWDELLLHAEQSMAGEKYAEAESALTQLGKLAESFAREDERRFVPMEMLAEVYDKNNKPREAEETLLRAVEARKNLYGPMHRKYADGLNRLAALYYEQARYPEAEPICRQVLNIYEKIYGSSHEKVAGTAGQLADTLQLQTKYEEAEHLFKRAIDIRKDLFGTLDAESVWLFQQYANLLEATGRNDEAEYLIACAQGRVSGIMRTVHKGK
jgi:tetratricopeptide (TPR) repeat protein